MNAEANANMSPNMGLTTKAESLVEKKEEVTLSDFSNEEQEKIRNIADQINIEDSQGVMVYGVGAQRDISQFADSILSEVRAKDSGYVGEVLTELVINVKELKVDSLNSGGDFLSKIPIIGGLVDRIKRFIAQYEKLNVKIETIVEELDKARMNLLKDITMLDNMYEKNLEYLKTLDMYVMAGQLKIKELQEKVLPELKKQAEESRDPADVQHYQDVANAANRFEKKVHDLQLSRMIAIQTGPQIRMIQNGNSTLVEKIQNSILTTIPLWKNQVVIAITIFRQKKALKLQKEITDTTNDLLKKNAAMMKQGAVEVAKESERGIVEIDTLKKVNQDLISTIEETIKIQQEGRQKRAAAEKELVKMEKDLKDKLVSLKG